MSATLKGRLADLRKKQRDLLRELKRRNIKTTPQDLSDFLNDVTDPPRSVLVLAEAEKIIEEWEAEENERRTNLKYG